MTWQLDGSHAQVTFSTKHMMVATVRGSFDAFDVDLDIDPENLERSSVTATLDVSSLTTGNGDRDAHLKSADFLDAEEHPRITFVSKQVHRSGDDVRVKGDLTIKGVTKEVELKGEVAGPVASPFGGGRTLGVSLSGEIDREAFGLTWNVAMETGGVLVGKKVKLGIEAEVTEVAAEVASAAQ